MLINVISFIVNSTNQKNIKSSFISQLVTTCIYAKTEIITKKIIKDYRLKLISDSRVILVTDLGFGSKKLKSNSRKISQIAKKAGSSNKYAFLLNRLIKHLNINCVLELGTSLGISSNAMMTDNKIVLDTIEGCPQTQNIAKESLGLINTKSKINYFQGDFNKVLDSFSDTKKYDLIFFDGNHQKEPTIDYFEKCLNHKHNNSVFIFDDIYWSKGMMEAWEYIKNHKEVTVTVDIFKWGIVFFRTEQTKEHFKIRF